MEHQASALRLKVQAQMFDSECTENWALFGKYWLGSHFKAIEPIKWKHLVNNKGPQNLIIRDCDPPFYTDTLAFIKTNKDLFKKTTPNGSFKPPATKEIYAKLISNNVPHIEIPGTQYWNKLVHRNLLNWNDIWATSFQDHTQTTYTKRCGN